MHLKTHRKSGLRDVDAQWLQPEHKQFWVATVQRRGKEELVGAIGIDCNGGRSVRQHLQGDGGDSSRGVSEQQQQGDQQGETKHASIHHLVVRL